LTPIHAGAQAAARASCAAANFYAAAAAARRDTGHDTRRDAVRLARSAYLQAQNEANARTGEASRHARAAAAYSVPGAARLARTYAAYAARSAARAARRRLAYVNALAREERARMRARRPPRPTCHARANVRRFRATNRRRTPRHAARLAAVTSAGDGPPRPDEPPGSRAHDLLTGGAS
jgi:hypothetical protein